MGMIIAEYQNYLSKINSDSKTKTHNTVNEGMSEHIIKFYI
jgi:hypothetical protein